MVIGTQMAFRFCLDSIHFQNLKQTESLGLQRQLVFITFPRMSAYCVENALKPGAFAGSTSLSLWVPGQETGALSQARNLGIKVWYLKPTGRT